MMEWHEYYRNPNYESSGELSKIDELFFQAMTLDEFFACVNDVMAKRRIAEFLEFFDFIERSGHARLANCLRRADSWRFNGSYWNQDFMVWRRSVLDGAQDAELLSFRNLGEKSLEVLKWYLNFST